MRKIVFLILIFVAPFVFSETMSERELMQLSSEDFLDLIRAPFLDRIGGEAVGTAIYRGGRDRRRADIRANFLFDEGNAEVSLELSDNGNRDTYSINIQRSREGASIELGEPEKKTMPALEEFGISQSDLAFDFLFWDFVSESRSERIRGQQCRVMRLRNPQNQEESVEVWLVLKFLFPLRVEWYKGTRGEPWRLCEFTDFQEQGDGLWFLKSMRVEGLTWRTRIDFAEVKMERLANPEAVAGEVEIPEEI